MRLSDFAIGINPLLEQQASLVAPLSAFVAILMLAHNANDTLQERMNVRQQFFKLLMRLHWFFMRVHWKLSKPPISKFYLSALSRLQSASDLVTYWSWRWIGIKTPT